MKFRKQFIILKKEYNLLDKWKRHKINDYLMLTHPDLEINTSDTANSNLVLLGDAFDYHSPNLTNNQIIKFVHSNSETFEDIIELFNKYSGTFIVIYYDKLTNKLLVFNDATAQREVYYYKLSNREMILASEPSIINYFHSLDKNNDKIAQSFFNSSEFRKRKTFIGNLTNFKDVMHLKPNYYLDVNNGNTQRFFPNKILQENNMKECAKKASQMIQGYLTAASNRYKLLLPVSAGWESRVLLAASKNITDKVYYYVFKHQSYSVNHPDIKIPKKLLAKLGLKLKVIENSFDLDSNIIRVIDESYSFPRYNNFKYIVNFWGKSFPNHLSVIGNVSEVARMEWDEIRNLDENKIAILQKYPKLKYATEYYKKWLLETKDIFDRYNYSTLDMLYWEENCGNWVAKANTEAKFGIEFYLPFNSRELLVVLLSADKKYRQKQYSRLYIEIINNLWPECLLFPINPGIKKKVISILQKIGIYSIYRNLLINLKLFTT